MICIVAPALLGHILGPDPHVMDPKIGPKIGPGRILVKPEALLRDIEYTTLVCPVIFGTRVIGHPGPEAGAVNRAY